MNTRSLRLDSTVISAWTRAIQAPTDTRRSPQGAMRHHFAEIATSYDFVRDTDVAPVDHVSGLIGTGPVVGLDIGCGTGRYTLRLADRLHADSVVFGTDFGIEMLRALPPGRPRPVPRAQCTAERLPLRDASLDFVCTFNAVHHFDLDSLTAEVARVLRPGGYLFVYTRTPEMNARSIWGRRFPRFTDMETRLADQAALESSLSGRLELNATLVFEFERTSSLSELQDRVRAHHYSTFSLYEPHDLETALSEFLADIARDPVCWTDQNLLVIARRAERDCRRHEEPLAVSRAGVGQDVRH